MRMVHIQKRSKPVNVGARMLIVSMLAISAMGLSPIPAATGAAPAAGAVTVTGTAYLGAFPCGPPACPGTFEGRASGSLAGGDVTLEWVLAAQNARVQADFLYDEPAGTTSCLVEGSAQGTILITGDELNIVTGEHIGPGGERKSITYFKADILFFWMRRGATAVVTTFATLQALVGGVTKTLILRGLNPNDVAVAAFELQDLDTAPCNGSDVRVFIPAVDAIVSS